MQSFHNVINFLKQEQNTIYYTFMVGCISYFGASCTLIWVYPSRSSVNMACCVVLVLFLVVTSLYQMAIDGKLKTSKSADGKIAGFDVFGNIADLDHVAARQRGDAMGPSHMAGMHYGSQ